MEKLGSLEALMLGCACCQWQVVQGEPSEPAWKSRNAETGGHDPFPGNK
ncbi:MAG: hypothetical protein RLY70_1989 [Planctomycetota bacterium]